MGEEDVWRAVVEAHEREVMMQRRCVCGYYMGQCPKCQREGHLPYSGAWVGVPGSPCRPTADELAQMARFRSAIAEPVGRKVVCDIRGRTAQTDVEEAIRAYARKLIAQRAAIVKSERITRTVHDLIKAAGGEIG